MTQTSSPATLFLPGSGRWRRVALACLIFVCGVIVGGVASRVLVQNMYLSMLQHPERIPDRILPRIHSGLGLSDDQARQVSEIVRRRHAAMESIRSRSYPATHAEFTAMKSEIAQVLTVEQRDRWKVISEAVETRYLPATPDSQQTH